MSTKDDTKVDSKDDTPERVATDNLRNQLDDALAAVKIGAPEDDAVPTKENTIRRLRRRRGRRDPIRVESLVEVDGMLSWEPGLRSRGHSRRRGLRRRPAADEVVKIVRFEELEPSQITELLAGLDQRFTPPDAAGHRGLRRWTGRRLIPASQPPQSGDMLLFVHGTFSNSKNFFDALKDTRPGRDFLKWARKKYSNQIYAFDHPTLAASPIENAVDLARLFEGSRAKVDTIAHSRGGVVVRWWYEVLSPPDPRLRNKAILVGSPLAGTSLASPPKWRSLMNYLTNLSNVLGGAADVIGLANPFLTVATAMLKIFGSATRIAASTPLADAAVALVPGLSGQSRVGNQPGLRRLRLGTSSAHQRYYAVQSDYEADPIKWKFWRVFNRPLLRAADAATDALFGYDVPNDLVVDVSSMSDIRSNVTIPSTRILDFGTNSKVHHTNYFAEAAVYEHMRRWLSTR